VTDESTYNIMGEDASEWKFVGIARSDSLFGFPNWWKVFCDMIVRLVGKG